MNETTLMPIQQLAKQLNGTVASVLSANDLFGFEKAYVIAEAAGQLKAMLTPQYMKPIMDLQNNRLGFKTDKPEGYKEDVVKNCLIEAVLMGVQPFGNQFNIIAGNCYITKEGYGYLLKNNIPGLEWEIIPALPRINADKSGAAIIMKVDWTLDSVRKTRELDIPTKMNQYMGTDGVIGKATRKARKWLYEAITNSETSDGDVTELESDRRGMIIPVPVDKEQERIRLLIQDAKTVKELEAISKHVPQDLFEEYETKKNQLNGKV
jgi:hypothetical protein